MKRLAALIVVAGIMGGACSPETKPETPREPEPKSEVKAPDETRTEAEVVRAFFLAMVANDEAGVRKEILSHPDAEVLWQGEPTSAEEQAEIEAPFSSMTCRECKVGEIVTLPDGKQYEVTTDMVSESRKILLPVVAGEPMPVPLQVVLVDGEWKVDAGPLVAARLAAKRVREKTSTSDEAPATN